MQCWSSRAGSQVLFHNWVGTAVLVGRMACLRRTAAQSTSSTMLAQLSLAPSSYCCCCLRLLGQTQPGQRSFTPQPQILGELCMQMCSAWLVVRWGCRVFVLWSERPSRWPQWLLATVLASFLPKNVLHDKSFPCVASQDRKGSRRRCLERHWDVCESTLHGLGCGFTSHPTVNCTLRKCCKRVVNLNSSKNKIRGEIPACISLVENQRAVAVTWGSDFIHSTGHDDPW